MPGATGGATRGVRDVVSAPWRGGTGGKTRGGHRRHTCALRGVVGVKAQRHGSPGHTARAGKESLACECLSRARAGFWGRGSCPN